MIARAEYTDIGIDRKIVCRQMGYNPDVEPSPRIADLIDEYLDKAKDLITPAYSYVFKDVKGVHHSSAIVEGPIVFDGQVVSQLLQQSSKVAIFVATIGVSLENTASRLAENADIVQSYALDTIGSCLTESLVSYVESKIATQASHLGLSISRRFSPGYCDWDISQQEVVFRALGRETSGVVLSDDCLMTPQKSVSGIIGMAPPENCIADYNPCRTCDKRHCVGRR